MRRISGKSKYEETNMTCNLDSKIHLLVKLRGNKRAYRADATTAKYALYDKVIAALKSDFVRVMATNSGGDFYICFLIAFHSYPSKKSNLCNTRNNVEFQIAHDGLLGNFGPSHKLLKSRQFLRFI